MNMLAMTFKLPETLHDPNKIDKLKLYVKRLQIKTPERKRPPFIEVVDGNEIKVKCKALHRFIREMQDKERIKVGYVAIYSEKDSSTHPHLHMALYYEGAEVAYSSLEHLEQRWTELIGFKAGGLVIKRIFDEGGWLEYLLKHKDKNSVTFFHNGKLLSKHNLLHVPE